MKNNEQQATLNILLADDDVDDRCFFDKAISEIPVDTYLTMVGDGEQLMAYFSQNAEHLPDVVFLDLNMPRKNGFECLSEIKENSMLKDIPVVMFSTFYPRDMSYEQDMIKRLYRIGALDYIRKPGDFEQLKQSIQRSLNVVIEQNNIQHSKKIV